MIRLFGRPLSIVVMMAVAQHLCLAVALMTDTAALNATGLHAIYLLIRPPGVTAAVLIAASCCSVVGVWCEVPWIVLLLIPQQILLLLSATGAFEAMWLGQFADGVVRPNAFIVADQIGGVLLAVGHTVAIIAHARRRAML
jgi:hypothetical protein